MPSSSSSSSVQIVDMPSSVLADPVPASGTADDSSDDDNSGGSALSKPLAERIASSLRTQSSLDAMCKKHGVPKDFTPLLAGDLRACSPPPPGAACVYASALEAGLRVPLHPFFSNVLSHFGVAPGQVVPNGWRIMAGFLALSRAAGVDHPPVAVFRHFFTCCTFKFKGWYCFRGKDTAGTLFTGLRSFIKQWKEGFFFLKSPVPWLCPVVWGEPSKSSTAEPELTSDEKKMAAKLLLQRGHAAIDLRTFLTESRIAAATMVPRALLVQGMDPSTYAMLQNMRAERASSEKVAVKSEPGCCDPPSGWATSLSGTKRKKLGQEEAREHSACAPRQVFSGDQGKMPDCHDGDTADREVARQLLQGIVTPSRERAFADAKASDVIDSTYIAILQAANYASCSLDHARRLQDELAKAKAELAAAKTATADEVKKAKAAAVQEFLGSKEQERRLVEEALKGYERGMEDMKRVALALRPDINEAQLVVPPGGFRH